MPHSSPSEIFGPNRFGGKHFAFRSRSVQRYGGSAWAPRRTSAPDSRRGLYPKPPGHRLRELIPSKTWRRVSQIRANFSRYPDMDSRRRFFASAVISAETTRKSRPNPSNPRAAPLLEHVADDWRQSASARRGRLEAVWTTR